MLKHAFTKKSYRTRFINELLNKQTLSHKQNYLKKIVIVSYYKNHLLRALSLNKKRVRVRRTCSLTGSIWTNQFLGTYQSIWLVKFQLTSRKTFI